MARFIEGLNRDQTSFLPACIDDYVDDQNPVRAIDGQVARALTSHRRDDTSLQRQFAENGANFDRVDDERDSVCCKNVPNHINSNFYERFYKAPDRSKNSHDRGKNSWDHHIRHIKQEND